MKVSRLAVPTLRRAETISTGKNLFGDDSFAHTRD